MKRVRGGGARDQLRAEGIVIFGDYAGTRCSPRPSACPGQIRASSSARGWPRSPEAQTAVPLTTPVSSDWPTARLGRRSA